MRSFKLDRKLLIDKNNTGTKLEKKKLAKTKLALNF